MKLKINELKPNESNPRIIKEAKFKKLVKSIQDFPEMLELRPIILDENNVILGGNMRYKACVAAGLKEVPVKIAKGLTEEQKEEFIVKDNVGFGEWDWDILGNEWNNEKLGEWGMDVWQPEAAVDYSVLEDLDLGSTLQDKTGSVLRSIQIEFNPQHYEEAFSLVNESRKKGNDVGLIVLNAFKNQMICFIPTKGRLNTKTYKLFEEAGIEVKHFIEPSEFYLYDVPNKINIQKDNQGISYVRNFMLQYAKENNHQWIIMCDDDINSFYEYRNGKNIKVGADVWINIFEKANQLPFELYGINNKQLIWTAKQDYVINKASVEACILMNVNKIDWNYSKDTKEDKDFALKTIKEGNGIVKFLKVGFSTPTVGSNKGGLHEKYKGKQDYKWAEKMTKKWHPYTKLYKTDKKVDVKINYKAFAKSLNKIIK